MKPLNIALIVVALSGAGAGAYFLMRKRALAGMGPQQSFLLPPPAAQMAAPVAPTVYTYPTVAAKPPPASPFGINLSDLGRTIQDAGNITSTGLNVLKDGINVFGQFKGIFG